MPCSVFGLQGVLTLDHNLHHYMTVRATVILLRNQHSVLKKGGAVVIWWNYVDVAYPNSDVWASSLWTPDQNELTD